jgi:hypothetical protein
VKRCYVCSEEKETRPYGEHGQDICFTCMQADPVQLDIASSNLSSMVNAASIVSPTGIVAIDGEVIRPSTPDDLARDDR